MPVLRPEFPDHGSPFSREQERRRKVDAIVSAAAVRFNDPGFTDTRLEDIAADLGLTKTAVSYYFATKEDLAEAVYKAAVDLLGEAVNAAKAQTGGPAAQFSALFRAYADLLQQVAEGRRSRLAALRDLDALPEAVRIYVRNEVSHALADINAILAQWNEEAGAPLGRVEPAGYLILALLDWMSERQSEHETAKDVNADLAVVLVLVDRGLCGPERTLAPAAPLDLAADETLAIFDRDARNRMKREAFLKAGSRLFNQRGYSGASLAEVASALGVSRGAFYYHIEDKEKFLDQCLERSLQIVERALDQAEAGEMSALDRLHAALSELIYMQAAGIEPLLRPGMAAVLPAARRRRHRTRLNTIARRLGDAVAEAAGDGDIRGPVEGPVEEILASILFLNGGYTIAASGETGGWSLFEDPRSATGDYLHLLLYGLGARRP